MRELFLITIILIGITSCTPSPQAEAPTTQLELGAAHAPQPPASELDIDSKGGAIACVPENFSGIGPKVIDISNQNGCKFYKATCDDKGDLLMIRGYNRDARDGDGLHSEFCRDAGGRWEKLWNTDGRNFVYAEVEIDDRSQWSLGVY